MTLEATVVCVDNSEWMRNGDFPPSRLEAQQDAVNIICGAKTQLNVENTVAICQMAGKEGPRLLATLTSDLGKILNVVHNIQLRGRVDLLKSLQVAQLCLKHRPNKNQRQRIVAFVGSPLVGTDSKELVKLAKKLKKNNVAVDVVNFGEDTENTEKLEAFVASVNSGDNSHLVTVPPGPHILADILVTSPILQGEGGEGAAAAAMASSAVAAAGGSTIVSAGGAGFADFGGVDPSLDPELALAMQMSMQEERARQERELVDVSTTSSSAAAASSGTATDAAAAAAAAAPAPSATTSATPTAAASTSATAAPVSTRPASAPAPAPAATGAAEDDEMAAYDEEAELAAALSMSLNEAPQASVSSASAAAAAARAPPQSSRATSSVPATTTPAPSKSSLSATHAPPPAPSKPAIASVHAPAPMDTRGDDLDEDDDELARAIALSTAQTPLTSLAAPSKPATSAAPAAAATSAAEAARGEEELMDDDELANAIALSMGGESASRDNKRARVEPSSASSASSSRPTSSAPDPLSAVMADRDFLTEVLGSLPGVDPNDERIQVKKLLYSIAAYLVRLFTFGHCFFFLSFLLSFLSSFLLFFFFFLFFQNMLRQMQGGSESSESNKSGKSDQKKQ